MEQLRSTQSRSKFSIDSILRTSTTTTASLKSPPPRFVQLQPKVDNNHYFIQFLGNTSCTQPYSYSFVASLPLFSQQPHPIFAVSQAATNSSYVPQTVPLQLPVAQQSSPGLKQLLSSHIEAEKEQSQDFIREAPSLGLNTDSVGVGKQGSLESSSNSEITIDSEEGSDSEEKDFDATSPVLHPPLTISSTPTPSTSQQKIQDGSNPLHKINRCKKSRTSFTKAQLQKLEIKFDQQKYLTKLDRTRLADTLKLTEKNVKTWFQNRRTKWKKDCSEKDWSLQKELAATVMYNQYLEVKNQKKL